MNSVKITEKMLKQLLAVRPRKVERIKSRLSEGKYHVKAEELAKSLLVGSN